MPEFRWPPIPQRRIASDSAPHSPCRPSVIHLVTHHTISLSRHHRPQSPSSASHKPSDRKSRKYIAPRTNPTTSSHTTYPLSLVDPLTSSNQLDCDHFSTLERSSPPKVYHITLQFQPSPPHVDEGPVHHGDYDLLGGESARAVAGTQLALPPVHTALSRPFLNLDGSDTAARDAHHNA